MHIFAFFVVGCAFIGTILLQLPKKIPIFARPFFLTKLFIAYEFENCLEFSEKQVFLD